MGHPGGQTILWVSVVLIIVVTLGLFSMLFIVAQKKMMDELSKKILENNSSLQNSVKSMMHEEHKKITEGGERDLFTTFVKLRNSIKENCIITMDRIHSCRIAIYLLHNGNNSTHGIKFFKMSCICEKVAQGSGIREQSIDQSNIPINLFDEMLDKLINNGRYIIINDNEVQNTNHRIFVSAPKIKYSQAVAIFDVNNNILGFVLAEMDHVYDRELALGEKTYIDTLVGQLTPILSYSGYVDTAINNTNS